MNKKIRIEGKIIRLASLEDEWDRDFQASNSSIEEIKRENRNIADIFAFWQRLPDIIPRFHYHMEWDNVAALEYKTYDIWYKNILDEKIGILPERRGKRGSLSKAQNSMMNS